MMVATHRNLLSADSCRFTNFTGLFIEYAGQVMKSLKNSSHHFIIRSNGESAGHVVSNLASFELTHSKTPF